MVEQRYSQERLAEEADVGIEQVKRLLSPHWGRKIQKDAIRRIAGILGLRPTDIVDPKDWSSPLYPLEPSLAPQDVHDKQEEVEETIPKTSCLEHSGASARVLISYRRHNPDTWLAQQLYEALQADGHQVFITKEIRPLGHGLSHIEEELRQCDRLLLLLSAQSAVSEMLIEEVRLARDLCNLSPEHKPVILTICIGLSVSALTYDLRGYLQKTWHREWQTHADTADLIQQVRNLLNKGDVTQSDKPLAALPPLPPTAENLKSPPLPFAEPELPEGQVDLASAFYVERPPIEARCYATIAKPGGLIRIKAPRQMGKTSLMARILHQAAKLSYLTVPLSFQLADRTVFSNLEQLLQWFCASISCQLEIPDRLTDYWSSTIGSKMSCTTYFERYLLPKIVSPMALGLDEIDLVFQYPEIASEFFSLLRAWHEAGKNRDCWKKLRLVVVHSTEVYVPLDINQSPFNVGLPIELPEFTPEQVHDLAKRHKLNWNAAAVEQLMTLVGGHPYLVRLSLYYIAQQDITLEQLLETGSTDAGPFGDHLRRHWWNLKKYPELAQAIKQVVSAEEGVRLEAVQAFKLHSIGLVHLQRNNVSPRCELYRQYFREHLGDT